MTFDNLSKYFSDGWEKLRQGNYVRKEKSTRKTRVRHGRKIFQ